jgi:hypothetical protein
MKLFTVVVAVDPEGEVPDLRSAAQQFWACELSGRLHGRFISWWILSLVWQEEDTDLFWADFKWPRHLYQHESKESLDRQSLSGGRETNVVPLTVNCL